MNIFFLNLEELLRLHFQLIEDYGGSHGIRDESRLQSVIVAPKQNVFGKEQYGSIFYKAAVYLRNIIGDHPFVDGNKRTALTACVILLARNGAILTANPQELEDFTVQVATNHLTIEHIASWLERNCHP